MRENVRISDSATAAQVSNSASSSSSSSCVFRVRVKDRVRSGLALGIWSAKCPRGNVLRENVWISDSATAQVSNSASSSSSSSCVVCVRAIDWFASESTMHVR